MKISHIASVTAALAVTILPFTASISAQDAPEGGRGERRERGERRGNPEEFRQRMTERLKTSMKVTDEEWSVIQPLMEKVQEKRRSVTFGRFGGFGRRGGREGGPGGPGGPGGSAGGDQSRSGAAESQALRTALENESASADELKAKLTAVRDARKKAQAELDQASDELRKVLTVRQEAALVSMGILE